MQRNCGEVLMGILEHKEFLERSPLVCHNAQFEHKWLLAEGIDANITHDTKLLAYLYDNRIPLDLESLCLRFNVDRVFKEEWGADVASMPKDRTRERNARDSRNTILLKEYLYPRLTEAEKKVYHTVLVPATKTTALIESQGLRVDKDVHRELIKDLEVRLEELELNEDPYIKAFVAENGEFNSGSALHKQKLMFEYLGYKPLELPHAKTPTGTPSTKAKVIDAYLKTRHTDTLYKVRMAAAYKGWISTYTSLFEMCTKGENPCNNYHYRLKDGNPFINTNLYLVETNTGRYKSSHPNLQNLPGRGNVWTRRAFIPATGDKGLLLEYDYDGIELRIIAGVSGDDKLLTTFLENRDPHVEMAKDAMGLSTVSEAERDIGKALNYALPFGRGPAGIAFDLGISIKQAKEWRDNYWKAHPELQRYIKGIPKKGVVRSKTGMKRYCVNWQQAKNFGIQNPALIALLVAANRSVDVVSSYAPIDLLIHDSFRQSIYDKRDLNKTVKKMKELLTFEAGELYSWLPIPLTVSGKVGTNWGEMEKIDA